LFELAAVCYTAASFQLGAFYRKMNDVQY